MKQGRTLEQLSAELLRQQSAKHDLVVSTTGLAMMAVPRGEKEIVDIRLRVGEERFAMNEVAHDQLGDYCGVPNKYYERMLAERPALLAENVNSWLWGKGERRMVRTMDGTARAFLSDSYRPLENHDMALHVFPVLQELGLIIMSCEVTDRRLYIKAVDHRVKKDIPTGKKMGDASHTFFDTISPAVTIGNSEVGRGRLFVDYGYYTKICTNLCSIPGGGGLRRTHVGKKHELTDDLQAVLSDEARAAGDRAVWLAVRDVVRAAFEEAKFMAIVEKLGGAAEQKIESNDLPKVVELAGRRLGGVTETEGNSILHHLAAGGDLTRYGLLNAVTRTAEDAQTYDRASRIERMGGALLELPTREWQQIARAA